jgi:LPS sulfotransferase NodH
VREKAATPNGVLGSKMMWNDFDRLRSSVRSPSVENAGLEFMRTTFPAAQYVWLRRKDKVRQGISWWRAGVTGQYTLRPDQEAMQPTPDVEQIVRLVRFAEQCEDGWRQWFASTGIQPCEVIYEDLVRDRLTTANKVLGFLRLPLLEAGSLPPVRYGKQADSLTDRYVDLVRSSMITSGLPALRSRDGSGRGAGSVNHEATTALA